MQQNRHPPQRLNNSIRGKYVLYVACFCITLAFAGFTARDGWDVWQQHGLDVDAERGSVLRNIRASTLLSGRNQFLGDARARYTLVEFGDYECPPCRAVQQLALNILDRYKGRVKLDFRQLPLSHIHPHAKAAAVAAESARPSGKFWILHQRLLAADLNQRDSIAQSLSLSGVAVDRTRAQKQIALDAALARQLSVDSTPSFFLCRPDNTVVRLPRLQAIGQNL
jgi:protein-disulfide isomerase